MKHARYYVYASLLPDGTVFVLGGRTGKKQHAAHGDPILEPELFDPQTEAWRAMAPMTLGREYHSSALLLPDGRVLAAGGNIHGMRRHEQRQAELFSPPYLHKGPQPEIDDAPPTIAPGQRFEIRSPQAKDVTKVVLIRPTSTTHCLVTDLRFVELRIVDYGQGKVTALLPVVPNAPYVAPAGHYMLFVLAGDVPSVARFVQVSAA
jgi:hypothetical protein